MAAGLMLALASVARAESVREAVGRHLSTELPEKSDTDRTTEPSLSPSTGTAIASHPARAYSAVSKRPFVLITVRR